MSDIAAVRLASHEHHAKEGEFPPSSSWGIVPPEMLDELPDGFVFVYKDATYRWQRLSLGGSPGPSVLLTFEVETANQELLKAIMNKYAGQVVAGNNQITFVIE